MEVEVLDASSNVPVVGFARRDCDDILVDGLRRPVAWGSRTLPDVERHAIRLGFWIYGAARLYAYRIH